MSRVIQQIATVQFQVDNRKVTASMNALQTEAESLNGKIAAVKQSIKALGDVPADNKFLLDYQKQLNQLKKDLDDVKAANRDLMKGVKAADQLWKAAKDEDIERLSIKAIKAGQNGLRKRMENLRPELGGDEQKMYDAYKAVIDEADRVMNVFKSNYATVVQTIRDGGIVSEQAMKSTRDALRDLMESEKEGTAEHRQLAQQYDFLNESLANVAEMRRREKGEIVNASDARREALKLTEDGIAAARRERDMADAVIAGMQQQKSDLEQQRKLHEDRIAQTEREIAANQRLEEAEQDHLADVEKAMRYTENEDRKEASRLRKKADAARDEAEAKKEAYEQQAEQEKLLRQHVKDTGDEVTNLKEKIEALGKTEAKPKVDTSEIDGAKQKLDELAAKFKSKAFKMTDEAFEKAFTGSDVDRERAMSKAALQGKLKDKYFFDRRGESSKKRDDDVAIAKENVRRAIFGEISSGSWSIEDLEQQVRAQKQYLESLKAMKKGSGLQHDAEYQAERFYTEELEKQLAIAKQLGPEMQQFAQAQQQGTTATKELAEAQRKYTQAVKDRQEAQRILKEVEDRTYEESPRIKQLNEEIAKIEELLAVSDKYKKQFAKMSDESFEKGFERFEAKESARKDIWDAQKYLEEAYNDKLLNAPLAHMEELPDNPAYKAAAKRVADGIMQNAQENVRRVIFDQIKNGNWSPEQMGELLESMRSQMNRAGNSELGLKDNPEYNAYKYIVAQMEKYLEVAKKVQEERKQMAGSDPYLKVAQRKSDYDKDIWPESLSRQKEKREFESLTGWREWDKKKDEDWQQANSNVQTAVGNETRAFEELKEAKKQSAAATKESTQADHQSVDVAKQKAELEGQLADATKNHTKAVKDYEAQQEKTNKAQEKAYKAQEEAVALNEKAATAEEDVAHQEERHAEAMDHQSERLRQIRAEGQRLLDQYEQQKTEIQAVDKAWADADVKQGEAEARKAQNQELTIKSLDDSIRKLKEANAVIDTNSDEWEENTRIIQRLQAALDEMKNKPALMMMTDRMQDVSKLSTAAVSETRKFWEAMVAGAERGSKELAEYEGHLKTITEEEQKRAKAQLQKDADVLKTDDLSTVSEQELQASIRSAKQLAQAMDPADQAYKELVADIIRAEEHVNKFGLAGETSTQKAELKLQQMTDRMGNLGNLSTAALAETKKFWETQVAGTEKGKAELAEYEARLKSVTEEEKQRKERANEKTAGVIFNKDLGSFSEEEIRKGIEAAKQIIVTYESAGSDAEWLAKKIVAAEEHLKQYGVEAERQAQKQAKSIQEMRIQLDKGTSLTESALKAQHNYWQKLIDDPKTAAENLLQYQDNLAETERLQRRMVGKQGQEALDWFRGGMDADASANDIKERATAMKEWRDMLPKESMADVIAEIDGYLKAAGVSAKKAAEELMDFDRAKEIALQAGDDIYGQKGPAFMASPEEIQAATKSIEKYREELFKTIKAKRDSGQATDAEEQELKELAKYLKDLKFEQDNFNMSREKMETLIKTPVSAANLDELRAAIKRADAELRRMEGSLGENSDKYKELAADVKNAKGVLKEMEGQAKATTSAFDKAWSRLKTYVGLYVGASVAMNKLMGTIGDIHELSDRMGEVAKTTDLSADAVGRLTTNLKKIDTRTGIVQLLELSAAAGQLGLKSEEDIQGFTEAANKLMVALPEMGKEAATEMMRVAIATGEVNKIQKEMQEGSIEGSSATAVAMEKIASTIDRLRASSASAAPEITDFVKRVGAVGAQSGITIDQVAALGSTVSSLGMRIEMSATALSRMIPAIKGNAFELSKAIGVTPETIRNLFDTGRGMEVILMILQRIKDSGMDADSIENMLGMAGMKDIMKDLNQQGARAGIVFSGLSQNVDELRRQLGVAKEAYEENIAIQKEYDRMNETTAAKWERLKNQVEEMFVGDASQRMLGGLIDGLKWLLSLITDNSRAFMYAAIAIGTFKAGLGSMVADGITKLKGLKFSIDSVKKSLLTWPNLWNAIGTVAVFAIMKIVEAATSLGEISKSMGEVEKQLRKEMATADKLFRSLAKVREEERHAAEAAKELAAAEEKKGKTVEKSTEKTNQLSKETDKLTKSEKDTAEQAGKVEDGMKRVNAEGNKSAAIIREINSKYGTYLGYMLSETSSARQLADARELINKKLRETITLKQREAAMSDIEQEYGGKVRKAASSIDQQIAGYFSGNDEAYARVSVAVSEAAQKYAKDAKRFEQEVKKIFLANKKYINQGAISGRVTTAARTGVSMSDEEAIQTMASGLANRAGDYRKSVEEYQEQTETAERVFEARTNVLRKDSREATVKTLNSVMADWREVLDKYKKAEGEEKEKLAVEVYKQQRAYNNLFANNSDYFTNDSRKGTIERSIENMKTYEKGLREVADESIRAVDAAERAETKITNTDFTNGSNGSNNPWGSALEAESTDWKNMTAEQLVNRRKQMKDFVNAIQTDTDVQSVLKEDAALKKAIENGMSADMRTVIEWYNTERLKIQDELHARHLTNTGDWMDPKKTRARKKMLHDETKAYLDELDAYYTERKAKIQEAAIEEGISEAEVRNRTLANEAEWRQRRMELEKMYGDKLGEVTKEEQDAIFAIIAERTEDDVTVVKGMFQKTLDFVEKIEKMSEQGAKEAREFRAKMDKQAMQDLMKEQTAMHQHMKAIQDIIDKERPFNGITKNLRENLVTMGILTADMTKERDQLMKEGADMADFNARQAAEELKRTTFMLGEAENAYSTTIEEVMRRMADAGMQAWADELKQNPKMQEGMMAQLRATYDSIQDAIKKEASLMKKQAEIMWNNILLPGGDGKTTIKDAFEKTIAHLGVEQGRVSRANSLIGAGQTSERVADKLAIKQMQLQLAMQQHSYNLMRKQGMQRIQMLEREIELAKEAKDIDKQKRLEQDKQHVEMSLRLAMTKEQNDLLKQQEEIIAKTEESQNRLYTQLKEWGDLLASSMKDLFEASHAGDREYYNERAKLNLTGKGGPGAGTYVVIDNEGTKDAKAHYEYLDERQALERQHEIEQQNAQAEAWKKVMDDLNAKMNEQITDWMNAFLQNQTVDANTQAVIKNTEALAGLTQAMGSNGGGVDLSGLGGGGLSTEGTGKTGDTEGGQQYTMDPQADAQRWAGNMMGSSFEQQVAGSEAAKETILANQEKIKAGQLSADRQMAASSHSTFAKMTQAANLYGVAYQAMSNDNLSTTQKFEMIALQAAGQTAMSALTAAFAKDTGQTASSMPAILAECLKINPVAGAVLFGVLTALIGGLMGVAASKITKSKAQIAQATGASSVSAGKLTTGMLTYAEGNVNEFTDPASLTPGRSYNVDAADGKTYRAKYTGTAPKTHLTNGPEFHLVGEAGREAIIDARTTRLMQTDDTGIWHAIQTLYNGGRVGNSRTRRGRGMAAFADGNVEEFEDAMSGNGVAAYGNGGLSTEQMAAFQSSLDRNNELLERALADGIHARFDVYGKGGLVDSYDTGKKNLTRHGERH